MKKQASIQITIPEPCHENWEAMTAVEKGRFCNSCQKVVTDFTQMDDAEIIRYFQRGKNLCGRFNNDQLNRPLQLSVEKPHYFVSNFYKKIAAGLLFGIGFLNQTFAQQKKQNTTQQPVSPVKKLKAPVIISGHLLDMETQKPLKGMTIFLKKDSFELQTKTNRWGGFTFAIPAKQQHGTGILSIDASDTNYIVVDVTILMNERKTNIDLFCYTPESFETVLVKSEKMITEMITTTMGGPMEIIALVPNLQQVRALPTEKKTSFWYRITHPFKKGSKKAGQ